MKFVSKTWCDICGKNINIPEDGVIEWDDNRVYLCHKNCSWGVRNTEVNFCDIELCSPAVSAEQVYEKLTELEHGAYGSMAGALKRSLFERE